jgi:predicted aspartyl protease
MPSFTTQVPNLRDIGPIVKVRLAVGSIVEEVLKRDKQSIPSSVEATAMIDTGATGTVIRAEIIEQLHLKPIGTTLISTPSSTDFRCYEYLMRILFPNNVVVETVIIAAPLRGQHIQCLIGRDILQNGVFIYTGYINAFTLSF